MGFSKLPTMLPICLAVFMAKDAMALGLGAANLDSKLGQPLFARIPIFGTEGLGSEQVRVSLQSVVDPKTGVEVGSVDTRSISAVGEIGNDGVGTIYLRSNSPVDEPYLHFLINIRWPGGELNRAYTLLLDLPENIADTSVKSVVIGNSDLRVTSSRNLPPQTGALVPAALTPLAVSSAAASQTINADTAFYTSVRGDSLWSIAKRLARAKGGNATEWMTRLYRNNPNAFIRNNRNLLKEQVTLDLFESVGAQAPDEPIVSGKPRQEQAQELHRSMTGMPGSSTKAGTPIAVLRREVELEQGPASAVLTEEQLLQQNLRNVRSQVVEVSNDIALMTEKLVSLQAQLKSLHSEYLALDGNIASNTDQQEIPVTAAGSQDSAENEHSTADEPFVIAADDGVIVVDPAVDNELMASVDEDPRLPVDTVAQENINPQMSDDDANASHAVSSDENSRTWSWLWWPLVVVAIILGIMRYRRGKSPNDHANGESELGGDLSDVSVAVAAKAQAERALTTDHFNDIFSSLDAKSLGAPTAGATPPEADRFMGRQGVMQTKAEPDDRTTSAGTVHASLADIDDDFFADLDEDALVQRGGLNDEAEFLALDIPDLDESWLASGSSQDNDAAARASACMELGDYSGARQILEHDIEVNDDVSLKMQLLDVYAHGGDQDEFENLALQVEFSAPKQELLREIDVLRELLQNNLQHFGKDRAD